MNDSYFNRELCKRFVSDNNLPIPIFNDKDRFEYFIDLYESMYHSKTLWRKLCDDISNYYFGDIDVFLEDYYDIRDRMINDILNNPAYQEFLKTDMSRYTVCDELKNVHNGNVYNRENVGKWFLSIDIKKANFQALHFFDSSIVMNKDTYEEYVRCYACNIDYIQNSKYIRQVVFGKCNPSRQITIEKHMLSNFYQLLDKYNDEMELVRFNNDELVFEMKMYGEQGLDERLKFVNMLKSSIEEAMLISGVNVSYDLYRLKAICLHSVKTNKDRNLNYVLIKDSIKKPHNHVPSFKEVPLTYSALITKLYFGLPINKNDYYFTYEGLDAYIDDDFILKTFDTKEDIDKNDK